MDVKISLLITCSYLLVPLVAPAIDASVRYRSPRNPERKVRSSTELIVLHTTEAPARSSLTKVSDRGECHFCVTEEGMVYAIVDRDREAFHAGRSMWRGKEDVDKFSIGIECVGYHDKPMPNVQIAAIAHLVKELQKMYRISDDCVVAHSHVAYGAPNKWHRTKHRGRKRCGMLFAMPSMRQRLGLRCRPAYDPDVRARRLVQADPYLSQVLYGNVDTMRSTVSPSASATASAPAATPAPAPVVAGSQAAAVRPPTSPPKSIADLKSSGYRQIGTISKDCGAMKIAGRRWNADDTYYTIRNKVVPGSALDPAHIEKGMAVWVR